MRSFTLSAVLLLLAPTLSACNGGVGPDASTQVGLGFQVAQSSTVAAAFSASADGNGLTGAPPVVTTTAAGLRIVRDADTLLITSAQLVVRDVKLQSATAVCKDDDAATSATTSTSATSTTSGGREDDDCPTLRIGPFLVNVPVTGADGARISVPVPAGTYSSLRMTLHKVTSNDSADAAFRQANPDFRDISARISGTFNKVPFTFVSDVNAKLAVPLTAPLVIKAGGDDVTVSIDFSAWFVRPQGGLYSPALANTPGNVRAAVQNNIRNAFRAFRDRDRDGKEDR